MEQPEELRYPVQAVVDLAKNFSREHFEYAITQCQNVISQVLAEDNSSEQQIARVRVLKYVNPTRIDDDEELLWKLCSKFIHPTSFVLDNPENTILNEGYRKVFAVKVLF